MQLVLLSLSVAVGDDTSGSTGCFVVTMNGTVASSLVEDAQVALAVPLTSAFKTEPSLTTTLDTMGTADLGEDAAKEDSGSSSIDMVSFHITLADTDNVGEVSKPYRNEGFPSGKIAVMDP